MFLLRNPLMPGREMPIKSEVSGGFGITQEQPEQVTRVCAIIVYIEA